MGKKFICPKCEKIVTQTEIDNELLNGGTGMCMCEFSESFINENGEGDVWFPRIFNEYMPYEEHTIEVLEEKAKKLYIEYSNWDDVIEMLPKKELKELLELYEQSKDKEKDRDYPY